MKRRKSKKPIPVFYYRVEHPSLRLIPISTKEFEEILTRLGYGLGAKPWSRTPQSNPL